VESCLGFKKLKICFSFSVQGETKSIPSLSPILSEFFFRFTPPDHSGLKGAEKNSESDFLLKFSKNLLLPLLGPGGGKTEGES